MLDYRMDTFLKLCEIMNYRITAEQLNMTQPAVTQHIHYLERVYGCRLFAYDGRSLAKTDAAKLLEEYARSARYDQQTVQRAIAAGHEREILRIGATKTIGEYILPTRFVQLWQEGVYQPSLLVDNTAHLLELLDRGELDIALIEGFFDRTAYGAKLYRQEPFVGICAKGHAFAGRKISIEELLAETLVVRESGSGTRAVLEQLLEQSNYAIDSFSSVCCVSSFAVTTQLVAAGLGISFVYQAVAESTQNLDVFYLNASPILREMNYVYLKNSSAQRWVAVLEGAGN